MKNSPFQRYAPSLFKDYRNDEEALYGLLSHIRDLGVPLISIQRQEGEAISVGELIIGGKQKLSNWRYTEVVPLSSKNEKGDYVWKQNRRLRQV